MKCSDLSLYPKANLPNVWEAKNRPKQIQVLEDQKHSASWSNTGLKPPGSLEAVHCNKLVITRCEPRPCPFFRQEKQQREIWTRSGFWSCPGLDLWRSMHNVWRISWHPAPDGLKWTQRVWDTNKVSAKGFNNGSIWDLMTSKKITIGQFLFGCRKLVCGMSIVGIDLPDFCCSLESKSPKNVVICLYTTAMCIETYSDLNWNIRIWHNIEWLLLLCSEQMCFDWWCWCSECGRWSFWKALPIFLAGWPEHRWQDCPGNWIL